MMWAVFDTNVLVSSVLLKAGKPAQAIQEWRKQRFLLITSPTLIRELRSTLGYDHIRRKYNLADKDVDDIVALLDNDAVIVPGVADVWGTVPGDPDDDHVLACAVDGQADVENSLFNGDLSRGKSHRYSDDVRELWAKFEGMKRFPLSELVSCRRVLRDLL